MTDQTLLALIKATPTLQTLANTGQDDVLAQAVPTHATVTIAKPFTAQDVLGSISLSDLAKFASSPMFDSIRQDIRDQNAAGLMNEATVAAAAQLITPAELAAIQAVVTATQQVPDTSVGHDQVSRVLYPLRADHEGVARAVVIDWSKA